MALTKVSFSMVNGSKANILDFGADPTGVSDSTAAIQAALDAAYDVYFPAGNYKINGTLTIRPYSNLQGAGKVGYVTSYTENVGEGTRLIQTTNAFLFSTSTGDLDVDYVGHITISDMTLLGGLVTQDEGLRGTYGLACYSSQRMICNRVYAGWFSLSGFRFYGGLVATMHDCEAEYNQNYGVSMDYGPFGSGETANSYMSYILGGKFTQNKNAGIHLGIATHRVSIQNADIESNGTYFSSGTGYGIHISSESNTVVIDGCWLEGNKNHIVIGPTDSLVTVPKGTTIRNTEFWTATNQKIVINSGTDCTIESCDFKGGGEIYIGEYADAPIIKNCYSSFSTTPFNIVDNNTFDVQFNATPISNVFPYPQIDTWGKTNCTVTVEQVASPAGNVPVYKITPSATGFVQIQSTNAVYAFAKYFHTYGWYWKTSSSALTTVRPIISSVNMPKNYTSTQVNSFAPNSDWKWFSLGRCIDFGDTGNQAFTFQFTVDTTDPVYITGFVALPGIVYAPYIQPNTGLSALSNSATPSVYGLSQALTGGTTTITDFTNGTVGQKFVLVSEHAITITDGTNIFLSGSTNFVMKATDTLTLIQKADGNWYEIARSVN